MTAHKFKVGESVFFSPNTFHAAEMRGLFKVVRLLPREMRDYQYRIQSSKDGHERVVRESEIS